MVNKFRVLPELLKKNNIKRKDRSIDSKITPKRLNKQQLLELQTIKREKQQFLKEIGLIGKTKDNYLDLN
jgi:hypothetical protein